MGTDNTVFNVGDRVSIITDSGPAGSDVYTEGTVIGFKPFGTNNKGFVVVQLSQDVNGEFRPHELTLIP